VDTEASGPTLPPPEHVPAWAWQIRGAGQSAAVLHARSLATRVAMLLVCGADVGHFASAGQGTATVGMRCITQSKSALGQSGDGRLPFLSGTSAGRYGGAVSPA